MKFIVIFKNVDTNHYHVNYHFLIENKLTILCIKKNKRINCSNHSFIFAPVYDKSII